MAVQKIALGINLRKNKIIGNVGFGKYYPEVDRQAMLNLRGFAQHMMDYDSPFVRIWNPNEQVQSVRSKKSISPE